MVKGVNRNLKQSQIMKKKLLKHGLFSKIVKISIIQIVLAVCFTQLCYSFEASGQEILETRVSIRLEEKSIKTILSKLEKEAKVKFMYSLELIQADRITSLNAKNQTLGEVLEVFLNPLNISFRSTKSGIVLTPKTIKLGEIQSISQPKTETSIASEIIIKGTVSDENFEKLSGVNINIKGTTQGTSTNVNGDFTISVPDPKTTLVFSFVGYLPQEVVVGNRTILNVSLKLDNKSLDEVVVIGYGTQRKRDLTGAITSIKPDEIKRSTVTTVANLLQGQVAGVVVSGGSGAPGARTSVRIRGTNSINAGNDPLYVVDGVMLNNGNDNTNSTFTSDGNSPKVFVSALTTINPDDIESMEVLKDASATAIYGARGSGGVILITTKKGKAGKSVVTFGTEFGFQKNANPYKMLNAKEFEQLNDEARANSIPALAKIYNGEGNPYETRMYDEMLRPTAMVQNYQIGVRGGTNSTTYNLSFNYFDQEGLMRSNNTKRYSVRINLESQANKWLKLGTLSSLTRLESKLISSNNLSTGLLFAPNQPVKDNQGFYSLNSTVPSNADLNLRLTQAGVSPIAASPLYDVEQTTNPFNQTRIISTNYAEITFLKDFKLKTALSVDILDTRNQFYGPTTGILGPSNAFTAYGNIYDYLFDNTLSYSKKIGVHSISAVVGANAQKHQEDGWSSRGQNLNDNTGFYNYVGSTLTDQTTITNASGLVWTMASFLGRVNYSYKDRYLATVSVRRDGSSRFGVENKYGTFPSVSLAWIASDEDFLKNSRSISQLKVRASYGLTGNQEIGLYNSLSTVGQNIYVLNSSTGVGRQPSRSPNPNLGWESTAQSNIGVDLSLFNGRMNITADVYQKTTTDLLYSLPIPQSSGFSNILSNIGEVSNKGWEFAINSTNTVGALAWTTNFNIARNYNRIEDLGGINTTGINGIINGNNILRVGESIGSFFGFVVDGIYQTGDDFSRQPLATPGEIKYRKTDDSPTALATINAADRQIIGNSIAKYTFGLTNNLKYKNIDLSIFFQGVSGRDLFNDTRRQLLSLNGRVNNLEEAKNRWTPENPSNSLPKAIQAGSRNNYGGQTNTLWIEDGSYLRLQNVMLGYTIPTNLTGKIGVSSLRIYGSVQNAFTLTNYKGNNPDLSGDTDDFPYPLARILSVGINAQF
jgi:TonB-dependent starch-binding outer membrane protein SusC